MVRPAFAYFVVLETGRVQVVMEVHGGLAIIQEYNCVGWRLMAFRHHVNGIEVQGDLMIGSP